MEILRRFIAFLLIGVVIILILGLILNIIDRISKHEDEWARATSAGIQQKT